MSTRAIVGIEVGDGKYMTAWNWNDGYPSNLGRVLRTVFTTKERVLELINRGSWGAVYSEREKRLFEKGYNAINFEKLNIPQTKGWYISIERVKRWSPKEYSCIEDMLQEDINYVYIFNPQTNTWKTYK